MAITRPNWGWCSGVTFIPVRGGFLRLAAIMDWATRKALSWRSSIAMRADFRIEALNEALERRSAPEVMITVSHTIGVSSRVVCLKGRSTVRSVGAAWLLGVI